MSNRILYLLMTAALILAGASNAAAQTWRAIVDRLTA